MKIAFAGKGGVGKTTIVAWTANYLARQGKNAWLIDADTALSLGQAVGLQTEELPVPLIQRKDIIEDRIGTGIIHMNPVVDDLPDKLAVEVPGDFTGTQKLIVMGTVTNAGGGCACGANALLKALLSHIMLERNEWVLVDLEAGVEHLGRGTIRAVDGLAIVSEPSKRGLDTAASIAGFANDLGLTKQSLILNRTTQTNIALPNGMGKASLEIPVVEGLSARQLENPSVIGLNEQQQLDHYVACLLNTFA